ncbi:MAG: hypothetical protein AVDCRST_MAG70-192 [uncultured Thermomicrobiales bacterium]|uniref:Uncharacterized protein n=1 Tax=uncultured Thermomicrobiales bacterium TaxID=1645740 RepID=A0A6J4UA09_9BACT|nr:MAG: hypothetical protein AVDCRST_MAG70-192 [uncultured Thermomicrobiales bacterium]
MVGGWYTGRAATRRGLGPEIRCPVLTSGVGLPAPGRADPFGAAASVPSFPGWGLSRAGRTVR